MKSLARIFYHLHARPEDDLQEPVLQREASQRQGRFQGKSNVAATRAAHMLLLLLMPLALLGLLDSGKPAQAQPGTMGYEARQAIAKASATASRPVSRCLLARRSRLRPHRDAWHRQPALHLLHPAADPRRQDRQDSHLLRVLAEPAAAAEPHPAQPQRHALRHAAHSAGQTPARQQDEEAEFSIPAELLVRKNILTIEFIGHYVMVCEDPANTTLWARVATGTYLDFSGDVLPLTDDLKQLPLPFPRHRSRRFAQASRSSFPPRPAQGHAGRRRRHLYFGMESENRPSAFPPTSARFPQGNAIVIAENPPTFPAA
jgi:hypothetical protein